MAKGITLTIWQDGEELASVHGHDFERVHAEAMHYAFMYSEPGRPAQIKGMDAEQIKQSWAKWFEK